MARARGRRTDYTWQGNAGGMALAAGGSALLSLVTAGGPSTLMRSRGEIAASIDGAATDDKVVVACGLIKATEEQVAVGITAIPDPFADLDATWLWHGFLCMQAQGTDQAVPTGSALLSVDSKAMRRLKQTESIVFVASASSIANPPATDLTFGFRLLFGD